MVRFERVDGERGVRIVDPVERRQYTLRTAEQVRPCEADPGRFRFPVDGATTVVTDELTAPIAAGFVRDGGSERVATVEPETATELPGGTYSVELNAPVKVYLRVSGSLLVDAGSDHVRFAFDGAREVDVGARSYHERPAATITVTDDPTDLLAVLPYLGSSLKTTSCERSFPTLRGHPPLLERGDDVAVPDRLERPDTGVTLELPAEYASLHVAAPLVYYLGADVRRSSEPRLCAENGFEHDLGGPGEFERAVERVLEQVFLLDCLTRTEGLYRVDLAERDTLEAKLDLDFDALYGRPLGRQLAAYLSVPFERLAEHVPTWALTAHLPPTAPSVEALPHVLDDLGTVRTASARELSPGAVRKRCLEGFGGGDHGDEYRGDTSEPPAAEPQFVQPATTGSLEEAWFGDGVPLDATRSTLAAFRNRLARDPREGPATVAVVCNAAGMLDERAATEETYGSRDELPFEVSIHEELTTDALAAVLAEDRDFLHYAGHIDDRGFECSDGHLDAEGLSSVGARAFLLNACESYEQGLALVEAGSLGGVVTLNGVVSDGALTVGRTMARLLDLGFPLRAALDVAAGESIVGGHYIVVGDGGVDVAQDETGIPILCDATTVDAGTYDVTVRAYLPREGGMGSLAYPLVGDAGRHFLAPGELGEFRLGADELAAALDREWCPVRVDGELFLPGDDRSGSPLPASNRE